jgi:hypothetical protein
MSKNIPTPLPSPEVLLSRFSFDPESGVLTYIKTGAKAGTPRPSGHLYVGVNGKCYGVHRLVYFLFYGVDPGALFVDHINHDPADNRPLNLRLATLKENTRNMRAARRDSSSGVRGVRWRERDKFWYATVGVDGKAVHIGCFKNRDDAIAAVRTARMRHFGEFSGEML